MKLLWIGLTAVLLAGCAVVPAPYPYPSPGVSVGVGVGVPVSAVGTIVARTTGAITAIITTTTITAGGERRPASRAHPFDPAAS
jgi:hypothetical protein